MTATQQNPDEAAIDRPHKHKPLTVRQVIDELERLAVEVGDDLPVHILVMHDESVERCW